jgi:CRISPR/Cas system-associated exonuclease Cas4 (RecB family)
MKQATKMELDHTSHSAVEEYKKCPQRFYLNRIVKVESEQWLAGPAGSAFHSMTEDYDNEQVVRPYEEYLQENLEEGVLYTHSRGEDYDWWAVTGPGLFERYKEWRRDTGWEVEAVEEEFRIQPTGLQWPVVGFIDRRFRSPRTGTSIICDIKTGYRLPENSVQLPIYYVADTIRRDQLGVSAQGTGRNDEPVLQVAVNYYDARRGNSTGLEWPGSAGWTEQRLVEYVLPAERGILENDWTAKPGPQCRYCPVRKHCEFKKGK